MTEMFLVVEIYDEETRPVGIFSSYEKADLFIKDFIANSKYSHELDISMFEVDSLIENIENNVPCNVYKISLLYLDSDVPISKRIKNITRVYDYIEQVLPEQKQIEVSFLLYDIILKSTKNIDFEIIKLIAVKLLTDYKENNKLTGTTYKKILNDIDIRNLHQYKEYLSECTIYHIHLNNNYKLKFEDFTHKIKYQQVLNHPDQTIVSCIRNADLVLEVKFTDNLFLGKSLEDKNRIIEYYLFKFLNMYEENNTIFDKLYIQK